VALIGCQKNVRSLGSLDILNVPQTGDLGGEGGGSPIFCSFSHNVLILNISLGFNVSEPFYADKFSFLSCKSVNYTQNSFAN
jgi:hypothetical protein